MLSETIKKGLYSTKGTKIDDYILTYEAEVIQGYHHMKKKDTYM